MLFSIFETLLICTSTWFLWKYFRHVFVKTPLDNVPGPASPSFWLGRCRLLSIPILLTLFLGNFNQLFARNGWSFYQDIVYNPQGNSVVKVHGLAGVSCISRFHSSVVQNIIPAQDTLRLRSESPS